jgi:hypothetical protein
VSPRPPYTVLNSRRVTERFQELLARAGAAGREAQVRQAAAEILRQLQNAPLEYGEARPDLAGLQLR